MIPFRQAHRKDMRQYALNWRVARDAGDREQQAWALRRAILERE